MIKIKFIAVAHSDVGIQKKVNQDGLCLKIANVPSGDIVLLAVCDGMGGLKKGELASATLIRAFSNWFTGRLPEIVEKGYTNDKVREEWENLIQEQNKIINGYGVTNHLQLGTTLTAMLIVGEDFIIVQIGDSRVYKVGESIEQLTEDQTVVQRYIDLGLITKEESRTDPRQNVLLQCIGASGFVIPEFIEGKVVPGEEYLLCSDGFRHKISEEEIFDVISPKHMINESVMKKGLIYLTELNKERQERDNITAMLVKVIS